MLYIFLYKVSLNYMYSHTRAYVIWFLCNQQKKGNIAYDFHEEVTRYKYYMWILTTHIHNHIHVDLANSDRTIIGQAGASPPLVMQPVDLPMRCLSLSFNSQTLHFSMPPISVTVISQSVLQQTIPCAKWSQVLQHFVSTRLKCHVMCCVQYCVQPVTLLVCIRVS